MSPVAAVVLALLRLPTCSSFSPTFAAGIDEVNLFKDDDTVIHFSNPKVQMSNGTNTFVVSGTAGSRLPVAPSSSFEPHSNGCDVLLTCPLNPTETKSIADIAPSILKQLNQEQLAKLLAQQAPQGAGPIPGLVDDE